MIYKSPLLAFAAQFGPLPIHTIDSAGMIRDGEVMWTWKADDAIAGVDYEPATCALCGDESDHTHAPDEYGSFPFSQYWEQRADFYEAITR